MSFLTVIGQTWAYSNYLTKEIAKFLHSQDRIQLEDYQVTAFKEHILLNIAQLNKDYRRCTPVRASWDEAEYSMDSFLTTEGINICSFHIYAAESIFND